MKQIIYLSAVLLLLGACDKDFVEVNTDPFAINDIDPQLLFAGNQDAYAVGGWESQSTIIQHFVNPFNDGATLGFNFNANIDGQQNGPWGQYTGVLKTMIHILHMMDSDPEKYGDMVNLRSMVRIQKAQAMMKLVDHYSNVPYFDIGLAAIEGEEYWYPAYDDDAEIYDDIYNELKEAIGALSASGDYVSADLYYGKNAYHSIGDAATQVAKWKKYGNSLLLRLGMRYSEVNPSKAESIVKEAYNGGVMTSNDDNAFVVVDGTIFTNASNGGLVNNQPKFYYAAEPFVDQLKSTNDPRSKYLIAMFDDPGDPLGTEEPGVAIEDQFGVPIGVLRSLLADPPYRGEKGQGYDYSQMNVNVVASLKAPVYYLTYAQTALLCAEAAYRGWISGNAKDFYEAGVKADMDVMAFYASETGSSYGAISAADQDAYLAQDGVAYNSADALNLINTQYWLTCIRAADEGWANFRRIRYPALARNDYNDDLLQYGGDGYVHRFTYPDVELSENKDNYQAAVEAIGGRDYLVSRVFWDVK